jgi:hypothetical protein
LAITSGNTAEFHAGTAGSFTVTTRGYPQRPALSLWYQIVPANGQPSQWLEGTGIPGLTFADHFNGTATLEGTPGVGTGGVWARRLVAHNGEEPDVVQPFRLTITEAPTITSPATATFAVGTADSFTITTGGYPRPTITQTLIRPSWLTFSDHGNGTATIAGTSPVEGAGLHLLSFTAHNGIGPDAVQSVTVTVLPGGTTPVGTPTVNAADPNGAPSGVTLDFAGGVTEGGTTNVFTTADAPPLPPNLRVSFDATGQPLMFEVMTTATYQAPIIICFPGGPFTSANRLEHFNAATGSWDDVTIRPVQTNGPICGSVDSLSPFAIVEELNTPPTLTLPSGRTVEATSPSGARVDYTVTATDPEDGPLAPVCSPASGSTFPLGSTTVNCAVTDSAGSTTTGSFTVLVQDTTPPAITAPPNQSVDQSTSAGALVKYHAPVVTDAGSGVASTKCSPASGALFRVGTTTVTCTATDVAGNTADASFTVTVNPDGRMFGVGHIEEGKTHHHFVFRVSQVGGAEYGRLEYWIGDVRRCPGADDDEDRHPDRDGDHDGDYGRDHRSPSNHFEATSITDVTFADLYASGGRQSALDTVLFKGTGKWNGKSGYVYEVVATDRGTPGRHKDTFSIVIRDARTHAVVASVNGDLDGGNIQTTRAGR